MAQQTINVGTAPNDGTGTPLRTAFQYTNSNFSELYTAVGPSGNNIVVPGSATITGDLTVDTNTFYVNSSTNRVGIGLTSPNRNLSIYGATNSLIHFTTASTGPLNTDGFTLGVETDSSVTLFNSENTPFNFYVNSTLGMTLNSTGLGVGGSPVNKMTVTVAPGTSTSDGLRVTDSTRTIIAGQTGATYSYLGIGGNQNLIYTAGGRLDIVADSQSLFLRTGTNNYLNLDASGNVGIGVTPSSQTAGFRSLEINGKGNGLLSYSNDNVYLNENAYFNSSWKYGSTATAGQYTIFQGTHRWNIAPSGTIDTAITWTQAMTLDASGNFLVGTTTNTDNFRTNIQFSGTSTNGLLVKNLASSGAPLLFQLIDSAQSLNNATPSAEYQDSTTQRWRLYKNGGLANYQANNVNLSDVRTKTDIKPLGSYWNKIKSLEVVTFKYKDQTHSDDNIGLIAQQVESVAPELVDADGFGNTPEDGVPLKTIYTTDLYHAAIKALQEAMTRIEALESKLA